MPGVDERNVEAEDVVDGPLLDGDSHDARRDDNSSRRRRAAARVRSRENAAHTVARHAAVVACPRPAAYVVRPSALRAASADGIPVLGPPSRMAGAMYSRTTLLPRSAGGKWLVVAAKAANTVEAGSERAIIDLAAAPIVEALPLRATADVRVGHILSTRVVADGAPVAVEEEGGEGYRGARVVPACDVDRAKASSAPHSRVIGHGVELAVVQHGAGRRGRATAAMAVTTNHRVRRRKPRCCCDCSDPVPRRAHASPPLARTATVINTAHSAAHTRPHVTSSLFPLAPNT